MCFSASASFAAGTALGAVGADTMNKVKKRELPFASIPLFFGIQQLVEGVVWLSFGIPVLSTISIFTYGFFSHLFWPVWIPYAVLRLEKDKRHRSSLKIFLAIGVIVALYLLYVIAATPLTARIVDHSILYDINYGSSYEPILIAYLIATCGSPMASSIKFVRLFGLFTLITAFAALHFFYMTFVSVWCFFAAILSAAIWLHYRFKVV